LLRLKNEIKSDDRTAFIYWAKSAKLENWEEDPIGKIKGVGINTFQYLRMMAGIDTMMPDKIVKRAIGEIFKKAGLTMPRSDLEFIKEAEHVALETSYKAIELCWMTWLILSEAGSARIERYAHLLPK